MSNIITSLSYYALDSDELWLPILANNEYLYVFNTTYFTEISWFLKYIIYLISSVFFGKMTTWLVYAFSILFSSILYWWSVILCVKVLKKEGRNQFWALCIWIAFISSSDLNMLILRHINNRNIEVVILWTIVYYLYYYGKWISSIRNIFIWVITGIIFFNDMVSGITLLLFLGLLEFKRWDKSIMKIWQRYLSAAFTVFLCIQCYRLLWYNIISTWHIVIWDLDTLISGLKIVFHGYFELLGASVFNKQLVFDYELLWNIINLLPILFLLPVLSWNNKTFRAFLYTSLFLICVFALLGRFQNSMNLRYLIPLHIWLFWAAGVYYAQQDWIKNIRFRAWLVLLVMVLSISNLIFWISHNRSEPIRTEIKKEVYSISQVVVAKNIKVLLWTYWRVYPVSSLSATYGIPIECTPDKMNLFRWFSNAIPEDISSISRYWIIINSLTKEWPIYASHGCTLANIENILWEYAEKIDLGAGDILLIYERTLSWSLH
jgi:hypothetical protein